MAAGEPKYEPGTKGHVVAYGDPENTFTFDIDNEGAVVNLRPTDPESVSADMIAHPENAPEEPAAETIVEPEVAQDSLSD